MSSKYIIQLVTVAFGLCLIPSASSLQNTEANNDCRKEQYFDAADERCHNCSQLVRLFEPGHWPVSSWRNEDQEQRPPDESTKLPSAVSGLVRLPQDKDEDNKQEHRASINGRAKILNNNKRTQNLTSNIMLSRLISVADNNEDEETTDESTVEEEEQPEREQQEFAGGQPRRQPLTSLDEDSVDQGLQEDEDNDSIVTTRTRTRGKQDHTTVTSSEASRALLLITEPSASVDSPTSAGNLAHLARLQMRNLNLLVSLSKHIGSSTLSAIDQCRRNQLVSACQQWANLCTLAMYAHSDSPASSDLDSSSRNSALRRSEHNSKKMAKYSNDRNVLSELVRNGSREEPISWQQCPQFSLVSICNSLRDWHRLEKPANLELNSIYLDGSNLGLIQDTDDVSMEPTSSDIGPKSMQITLKLNNLIQLIAYKYSFDGKLIEVSQFDLQDFSGFTCASTGQIVVSHHQHDHKHQLRAGQNYLHNCRVNVAQLIEQISGNNERQLNDTIFYELFIGHSSSSLTFIRPVPIVIKNLLLNSQLINLKFLKDPSRWQLARRFFYNYRAELKNGNSLIAFVRNAKLDLKFKKQTERGGFLLSSISLILEYGLYHKQSSETNNSSAAEDIFQAQVSVEQNLIDMQNFRKDLDWFVSVLCILSCLWSLIKCNQILKYHSLVKLDIYSLIIFIIFSCDTIGYLLALINLSYAIYLFTLFKLNTMLNTNNNNLQLFSPSEELEDAILLNIRLAFLFKLIGFVYKICVRLNADIFFIDWEKPKMLTSMQIVQYHYASANNQNKTFNEDRQQQQQSTGFWRPYSVINRWLQLLNHRRCNLTVQLVVFLCIMQSNSLIHQWTTEASLASIEDYDSYSTLRLSTSRVFRTFVLASIYLAIALLQYAFKRILYEPMFRSLTGEFVDLCSVANISLFAMLYPRFGYYVHGRNANGWADCGLIEMNALLEREERELCSRRGLALNSDHQTFIMILPRIVNDHYKKLLFSLPSGGSISDGGSLRAAGENLIKSALNLSPINGNLSAKSAKPILGSTSRRALVETIVAKNKAINLFLTNFLDHIYKDIDYTIRKRRRFESLLFIGNHEEDAEQREAPNVRGPLATSTPTQTSTSASEYRSTFYLDSSASCFTSLLLVGVELDLILCELFCLLCLDHWLGPERLPLTVSLLWLANKLFIRLYLLCAKENLVRKSMLDEKFLIR